TQLIEPYLSTHANPMVDALCREGIGRAARALPIAYRTGQDRAAREEMALASLLGGLALANAGLGAVHGFAAAIGGMFDAPHGAVCAVLLPQVFAGNLAALAARAPDHPLRGRFDEVGRLLTGRPGASAGDAVRRLAELIETLGVPRLREYGLASSDIP